MSSNNDLPKHGHWQKLMLGGRKGTEEPRFPPLTKVEIIIVNNRLIAVPMGSCCLILIVGGSGSRKKKLNKVNSKAQLRKLSKLDIKNSMMK